MAVQVILKILVLDGAVLAPIRTGFEGVEKKHLSVLY